jgi:ectoine hydroxylase-related dioxygenase (phytanoyl-CoA dioxygenase family)
VPRLRAVTSDAYLTSGVGYAHHLHRDTWYSAPMCQINWWLPIFPMTSESSMAFHPVHWDHAVANGSADFNYYEWNSTSRANAAQHIKSDTRPQPKPLEPIELDPQIRLVTDPGGAILFSAAQMHSTVPNTSGRTRFSIDFRTVHLRDLRERKAATNIDSKPIGTSLRDFMRGTDLTRIPDDVVSMYDNAPINEGVLVFTPEQTETTVS